MASATLSPSVPTITDTPPRELLQRWWRVRQADPDTARAFTDDAPRTFAELRTLIVTDTYLFYLAHDSIDDVLGAMWLHDLVCDEAGVPRAGWLGTYVLPPHRGARTTQAMWLLIRDALEARGVRSVYIASHHANTRAHRVAEVHLGFHPVGMFPAFARFGGKPTDCMILSMRPEDMGEAWALAYERASHQGTDDRSRNARRTLLRTLPAQQKHVAID